MKVFEAYGFQQRRIKRRNDHGLVSDSDIYEDSGPVHRVYIFMGILAAWMVVRISIRW